MILYNSVHMYNVYRTHKLNSNCQKSLHFHFFIYELPSLYSVQICLILYSSVVVGGHVHIFVILLVGSSFFLGSHFCDAAKLRHKNVSLKKKRKDQEYYTTFFYTPGTLRAPSVRKNFKQR